MNEHQINVALSAQQVLAPLTSLNSDIKNAMDSLDASMVSARRMLAMVKTNCETSPLIGQRQRMLFQAEEALDTVEQNFRANMVDFDGLVQTMHVSAQEVLEHNPFHREAALAVIMEIENRCKNARKSIETYLEELDLKRAELLTIQ